MNVVPSYPSGNAPPVYTVSAHADVNCPASVSRSNRAPWVIGMMLLLPWSEISAIALGNSRCGLRSRYRAAITSWRWWIELLCAKKCP